MGKRIEYNIGDKVGELIFMGGEFYHQEPNGRLVRMATFKCKCGNEIKISIKNARNGNTKSCGCYYKETRGKATYKHGMHNSITYSSWEHMIDRCYNKNNKEYWRYGGSGILCCDEWLLFVNFFKDMGERPSSKYSIDRINNKLGYFKNNCRWATQKEQLANREISINIQFGDELRSLIDVAKIINIPYDTLYSRIKILGWSHYKAINFPVKSINRKKNIKTLCH